MSHQVERVLPGQHYRVVAEVEEGAYLDPAEDGEARAASVVWKVQQHVVVNDVLTWTELMNGTMKYTGCVSIHSSIVNPNQDGSMLHFDALDEMHAFFHDFTVVLWGVCFFDDNALMKWAESY